MRVVSLIASSTEIVCALGEGEQLVARSHECDFPAWVTKLPKVTEPKFALDGTSYQIDQRVKAIVQEGLSVYRVDAAQLDALEPDVILTQSQCEVCAVSTRDVEDAVCRMVSSKPRIVSLEPNALEDVWRDIAKVADALGVAERGRTLIAELQGRIDAVAARARTAASRPTVACIEWVEPLMAAGNWMPTLVELAGGVNLFGEAGKHSPWMSFDELCDKAPDVIVILPCGYDIARARQDLPYLERQPRWASLAAVRERRVFVADGNQYFNRPGPRVVESLEILAELLHPELFPPRHADAYWRAGAHE
ncbi:MAG: periplasmic binding protein [Myxococcales bacterium]|nr:periplasmic binding protein [Myxococcales bacterium]